MQRRKNKLVGRNGFGHLPLPHDLSVVLHIAKAEDFFRDVKRNARIMSGNRQVAEAVCGQPACLWADRYRRRHRRDCQGMPVEIVFRINARTKSVRCLFRTRSSLIKDSPHPKEAEKLLDFLLSADVERQLARAERQIPLQPGVEASRGENAAQVRDGSRLVGGRCEMGYGGPVSERRICGW